MTILVIESTPTRFSWSWVSGMHNNEIQTSREVFARKLYGYDEIVWTDGSERLSAFNEKVTPVGQIWEDLYRTDKDLFLFADQLILGAKHAVGYEDAPEVVVFLIPEGIPEIAQDALIDRICVHFGVNYEQVHLLWRSVAISLYAIAEQHVSGQHLILDFAHSRGTATELSTKTLNRILCPVRPFQNETLTDIYSKDSLDQWLRANYGVELNDSTEPILHAPGFQYPPRSILEMLEGEPGELNLPPQVFQSHDMHFRRLHRTLGEVETVNRCSTSTALLEPRVKNFQPSKIFGIGWSLNWQPEFRKFVPDNRVLLPPDCVSLGAVEFARRLNCGQPTFFQELPGFDIWCRPLDRLPGRFFDWEHLIHPREVLGTSAFAGETRKDFALLQGSDNFSLEVRYSKQDHYRKVTKVLPAPVEQDAPIEIHTSFRPTGGSIKIAIRAPTHPDLFGTQREVALEWNKAADVHGEPEQPKSRSVYSYPDEIVYSGCPILRESFSGNVTVISELLGNNLLNENFIGAIALQNYIKPFKPDPQNKGACIFGNSSVLPALPDRWLEFFDLVGEKAIMAIDLKHNHAEYWQEWAGALFHYSPEAFRQACGNWIDEPGFSIPTSGWHKRLHWALGRSCRDPQIMDNYLKMALAAWPELHIPAKPNQLKWEWLFWPFQKSLSLYPGIARIPRETAFSVMEKAAEALEYLAEKKPVFTGFQTNLRKWVLAAVLFGLRVREIHPEFLQPCQENKPVTKEDRLYCRLVASLKCNYICNTPIPPVALANWDAGQNAAPKFPELILRFLQCTATASDNAMAGGIAMVG
jgi:hypothetical protein